MDLQLANFGDGHKPKKERKTRILGDWNWNIYNIRTNAVRTALKQETTDGIYELLLYKINAAIKLEGFLFFRKFEKSLSLRHERWKSKTTGPHSDGQEKEKPVWSTDKNKSLKKRLFHSTSYKRIIFKSPLRTESNRNYKKTVAETQHTLVTENNRR